MTVTSGPALGGAALLTGGREDDCSTFPERFRRILSSAASAPWYVLMRRPGRPDDRSLVGPTVSELVRLGLQVERDPHDPYGSAAVCLDPERFDEVRSLIPDQLLLEERAYYVPAGSLTPEGLYLARWGQGAAHETDRDMRVQVLTTTGVPLPGATIQAWLDPGCESSVRGATTGEDGVGRIWIPPDVAVVPMVMVDPGAGYWNKVVVNVDVSAPEPVLCEPIAVSDDGRTWVHEAMAWGEGDGTGVRIAFLDTGIDATHGHLRVEDQWRRGGWPSGREDLWDHGTRCAGVVASRPGSGEPGVTGLAREALIYSAQVFGHRDRPPELWENQAALVAAIEHAVYEWRVDLINLSLSVPQLEDGLLVSLQAALRYAADNGVLCVAAAGNLGGPVTLPGRLRDCVAVTALGTDNTGYPRDSGHARQKPEDPRLVSPPFFSAAFNCRGSEVGVIAPGVAVMSTAAHRRGEHQGYGAADGTSLSTACVVGFLASELSSRRDLLDAPRDRDRWNSLVELLEDNTLELNLPVECQGRGLPQFTR